jgi:hypothetical protein
MRMRGVALAGTLALALAACGSKNEWAPTTGGGGGEGGGGGGQSGPCADGVTLKVVGIDPGTVTSLALTVGSVNAAYEAGGSIAVTGLAAAPLKIDADADAMAVLHLTGLDTQWGHALVHVTFSQGTAFLGNVGGALDLCTAPLLLHVDPGLVHPDTCEAFLKIDVARSVAAGPFGLAFLPQYRVVYY